MKKGYITFKLKNIITLIILQINVFTPHAQQLDEKAEQEFSSLLIKASGAKIGGDLYIADSLYNRCLKLNPNSAVIYFEKSGISRTNQQIKESIKFAEKSVELSPSNEWYLGNLALLYKEDQDYKNSADIFQKLSILKPQKIEYLFSLTEAYLASNEIKKSIKTLSIIERKIGANEDIAIQKHQLYVFIKKRGKALKELEKLVASNPDNLRHLGLLAEYYESLNKNDQSLLMLERMMKLDSNNGLVRLSMFQHFYKNQNYKNGFRELKEVMNSSDVDQELKKEILLQISYDQGSPYTLNNVNQLTELFLNLHPKNSSVLLFFGNLKFLLRKEDSACYYLRKSLEINPNEYDVWVQLISSNLSRGEFSAAIKDAESAIENHPNQPFPYFAKGFALNVKKEFTEALSELEKGKELVIENSLLESDFYHQIAEAYYNLNVLAKSFENFEIAISLNPENLILINNYSYYLALNKQNLERAEKLIIKAVSLSPRNSTYLDTYGWVLFQKEKYEEAEEIIFKAVMNSGEKVGEIIEHYGDVMFKLGKPEEALLFWNKAKKTGNYTNNLSLKLKQKKYVD